MQYLRVDKDLDDPSILVVSYDGAARDHLGCIISAIPKVSCGHRVKVNDTMCILETNKRLVRLVSPIAGIVCSVNGDMERQGKGHLVICTVFHE